jgi:hypothetical protein
MDGDIIGVGMMVAIIILASAWAKRIMWPGGVPTGKKIKGGGHVIIQQTASADRQKALQVYENLAKEKLDVIKTALAMGWNQDDLSRLDARLERLIGRDQLQQLARGEVPSVSADLQSTSISHETALLREIKAAG